jgi:hypothetical protein
MNDPGSTITNLTLDQTNDIAMSIDEVLTDPNNKKIIDILTAGTKERELLLKDLFMNVYVRGFFAGMQHAMNDESREN